MHAIINTAESIHQTVNASLSVQKLGTCDDTSVDDENDPFENLKLDKTVKFPEILHAGDTPTFH